MKEGFLPFICDILAKNFMAESCIFVLLSYKNDINIGRNSSVSNGKLSTARKKKGEWEEFETIRLFRNNTCIMAFF